MAHALSLVARYGSDPWPNDGHPLPDEPQRKNGEFVFPSVVYDGVGTHHRPVGGDSAAELADLFLAHLDDPAPLLDFGSGLRAVDVADDLVRELRWRDFSAEKLHGAARFVVEHATRREVAKLGIVVLGVCGDDRDRELLQLIGRLDEFSLFAVVALMNTQSDRQRAVFELARHLSGWGRIHAVERLARCVDPEIRAWLLRGGFRNGVMDEYLAHLAATTGGLYEALLQDEIDDALLDGAAGILSALASGGPAEDMRDYDDAVPAMHRFAELLESAEGTIGRLDAALVLRQFAHEKCFDWPDGEPERLRARYAALLDRPRWRELVENTLESEPGTGTRYLIDNALSCASRLGMDVLPNAMVHLRIDSLDAYRWQWAMKNAGADRIEQVVRAAGELLPLAEVTVGPSNVVGIGPEYAADACLECVVYGLEDHPGLGSDILRQALRGRGIRCRRSAVRVLAAWPGQTWPPSARDWIAAAVGCEPDAGLCREMTELLAG